MDHKAEASPGDVERWEAKYRAAPAEGLFGAAPNLYLRAVASRPDFAPRAALFLADGDGRNARWLAGRGVACAAIDLSEEATRRARALDAAAGVAVARERADIALWEPGERRWDAALLLYLQGPAALRRAAIERCWRALSPGGWFVLEGFAKTQAGGAMGPGAPELLYDRDEALAAAPGAETVEALTGQVRLEEGDRHNGVADVLRLLLRKGG